MLEKIDLNKSIDHKEYTDKLETLSKQLSVLQRECLSRQIPIMVVFEGWGASGKGDLINNLIHSLDPRGFKVFSIDIETEEDKKRPYLCRFWNKIPAKGQIAIFDRSWYRRILSDRMDGISDKKKVQNAYDEILNFEDMLIKDGMLIIKFFLHISKHEQKKRLHKLEEHKETAWRVTKADWKHNKNYEEYLAINNEMLEKTDMAEAPWSIVEATDLQYAEIKVLSTVVERMETELTKDVVASRKVDNYHRKLGWIPSEELFHNSTLDSVDLSLSIEKEEYRNKLEVLQEKIAILQNKVYLLQIPIVIVFEGWDAAGKGGTIKRLTECLDPRGYEVIPIAAPNDIEKEHHYMWRFYNKLPKASQIAIYDRSWYGRVLVERVEELIRDEEWKRAYSEINQLEKQLTNAGTIVMKFWLHIDKEEQGKRFKERQENPEKQWKITEEDWRNRAKWDEYEKAVDEMLIRTSTTYAPWTIVEANSKNYARIKLLETVMNVIEKYIENLKK
ncbi:polyphosphate:AMP phosphotransferase [Anaeromicropila herbilytica]|uniref:Polyphosphate:AMP phosphotransferase n=1 Tax=Anaeromicropila herbilytica TaxID=2785025 RepID=A0A7R7EKM0_9FIRM|nr:polyphosphate:AMP phosphotransferase [Anaeromicropila herbilytica]BCN30507.1 polyphosphate:AMP phosphotransferase [Anaeromicropila herbilytica]